MTVNYVNHTTTYNSIVEVTCRPGTVPSSHDTVWTCDSQGQWSLSWNFHCRGVYSYLLSLILRCSLRSGQGSHLIALYVFDKLTPSELHVMTGAEIIE